MKRNYITPSTFVHEVEFETFLDVTSVPLNINNEPYNGGGGLNARDGYEDDFDELINSGILK